MFYPVMAVLLSLFTCLATLSGAAGARLPASCGGEPAFLHEGGGADPWYCLQDGVYYYCYSVGNGVAVKSSDTLEDLYDAEGRVVYRAPGGAPYSTDWWAPELHYLDGMWYIYVAADDGANEHHRMYALQCDTPDGDYTFCGQITDPTDRWAIDGTVVKLNGQLYFVWSGWEGETDGGQNLYIAHMADPTHIDGERHLLSSPDKKWEKNGMPINEGPAALYLKGRTHVVYSASGSWTDEYCLGMLTYAGGDPLNRANWAKCPVPVFQKTDTVFGPGHCSFVTSKDGKTNYIVYHGNDVSGTGWSGRSVRVQQFATLFGVPVFGTPITP